jgi:hypothetical protein
MNQSVPQRPGYVQGAFVRKIQVARATTTAIPEEDSLEVALATTTAIPEDGDGESEETLSWEKPVGTHWVSVAKNGDPFLMDACECTTTPTTWAVLKSETTWVKAERPDHSVHGSVKKLELALAGSNRTWQFFAEEMRVKSALVGLHEAIVIQCGADVAGGFALEMKPEQVLVKQPVAMNGLAIAPVTNKIFSVDPAATHKNKRPDKSILIDMTLHGGIGHHYLSPVAASEYMVVEALQKATDIPLASVYWHVRRASGNPLCCNCEIQWIATRGATMVQHARFSDDEVTTPVIRFPVIVNTRSIMKDEELVIFDPSA